MDTYRALSEDNMPGMGTPLAPFVEAVGAFKREVGLPVFHATRISDLASARYAVGAGKLDLVGMTRAHIADPHLVRKMMEGRETEIRPCVGATHCQSSAKPACLHNASTGREKFLPYTIPKTDGPRKSIIVVGGGPAGLEAARISAERGHKVTIHEAAPDFGGQVRLGARGWRKDLLSIVDWRVSELERLGVIMHLNSYVESEDLLSQQPDVIIVATGGMPLLELGGAEFCTSAWDVIAKQVKPAGRCMIYDGTGRHPALLSLVETLDAGAPSQFVSIDQQIGEELTYAERLYWRKRLAGQSIDYSFGKRLVSLSKSNREISATVVDEITRTTHTIAVDMVISDQGSTPNDELFKALRDGSANQGFIDIDAFAEGTTQPVPAGSGYSLFMIGDAAASRNIHAAVLDAARICTTL
ncbi:MAG TPA: NAD(P)-binding protein [Ochrobactrum intermedium]|uniref:NAD(P)-binding protein n=1 Tax=Brucella intermedia TaxID=94625 RepID=A0A7V6PC43_9HYPH|nr:NAD(P)-binding protein [Brucella intermedia]HHV68038.1 NAD(P)-binding protein [Brucella intermedia]